MERETLHSNAGARAHAQDRQSCYAPAHVPARAKVSAMIAEKDTTPSNSTVWRFTLTPARHPHESPLSDRLSAAARYLEAHGVRVESATLALDAAGTHPGEVERIRHWLKFAGRRAGLRASWPHGGAE